MGNRGSNPGAWATTNAAQSSKNDGSSKSITSNAPLVWPHTIPTPQGRKKYREIASHDGRSIEAFQGVSYPRDGNRHGTNGAFEPSSLSGIGLNPFS
jgi:hypothetical protein